MAKAERILIVDDDEDAADFAARFLKSEGYEVRRAGSGPEALRLVARRPFDLVLLDVRMPAMDGSQVLDELLAGPRAPAVLVFTGDHGADPRIRAMTRRSAGIVLKPFKLNELRRLIQRALKGRAR